MVLMADPRASLRACASMVDQTCSMVPAMKLNEIKIKKNKNDKQSFPLVKNCVKKQAIFAVEGEVVCLANRCSEKKSRK